MFSQEPVLNAWGKATPYGVSRLHPYVADVLREASQHYFDMNRLQEVAGQLIARWCGAETGTVVNCTAAAVTIAVAACMTGEDLKKVAQLPANLGTVVIQKHHCVNYGHPIIQGIRLAGAKVHTVGHDAAEVAAALAEKRTVAMVFVESHLVREPGLNLDEAASLCAAAGIPLIVDGAAQDMRMEALVSSGADLVLTSAQKYLCGPTAGIMAGKRRFIAAARLQEKGIGRTMKTSKEAVLGTCAAIEARLKEDLAGWRKRQDIKLQQFMELLHGLPGMQLQPIPDPNDNGFSRVAVVVGGKAAEIRQHLLAGQPRIVCAPHRLAEGALLFELADVSMTEIQTLCLALKAALETCQNTP